MRQWDKKKWQFRNLATVEHICLAHGLEAGSPEPASDIVRLEPKESSFVFLFYLYLYLFGVRVYLKLFFFVCFVDCAWPACRFVFVFECVCFFWMIVFVYFDIYIYIYGTNMQWNNLEIYQPVSLTAVNLLVAQPSASPHLEDEDDDYLNDDINMTPSTLMDVDDD